MAANKIEKLRKGRGWTRKVLAEKSGLSESMIVKMERGERRVPDDHARTFAKVFGVTAGEVIEGVDELQRVPVIEPAELAGIAYGAERPDSDRTIPVLSDNDKLVAIEAPSSVLFTVNDLTGKAREKSMRMPGTVMLILDPSDADSDGIFVGTRGTALDVVSQDERSKSIKPLAKIVQVIGTA